MSGKGQEGNVRQRTGGKCQVKDRREMSGKGHEGNIRVKDMRRQMSSSTKDDEG